MANWRKTRTPASTSRTRRRCPAYADPDGALPLHPVVARPRGGTPYAASPSGRSPSSRTAARCSPGSRAATRRQRPPRASSPRAGRSSRSSPSNGSTASSKGRIGRRRGRGKAVRGHDDRRDAAARCEYHLLPEFGPMHASEISRDRLAALDRQARAQRPVPLDDRQAHLRRVRHLRVGVRAVAPPRHRATRCASSSCRPTTRSRVCASPWRPRRRRSSPPSSRRIVSPTRSPSTPACAARRSTASNGPTSSTATASPTRLLVRRSKSEAGTQRRPPIADNLRNVLADAWERQGRPREGKVVDVSVMSGKIAAPRRRRAGTPRA